MRPNFGVYIGRFQPFHNGHLHVLREALKACNRVIVVLGSSNGPRTIKNPFDVAQRMHMILSTLHMDEARRVSFVHVEDSLYNDTAWATDVAHLVQRTTGFDAVNTVLVGHEKAPSESLRHMFPQWGYIGVGAYEQDGRTVNATELRDEYLRSDGLSSANAVRIPAQVREILSDFRTTDDYVQLRRERLFIDSYHKAWAAAPYPPTFVTVDACVVQQGHILLIERRAEPGKGLWALPGGFLNQSERIIDATIRELREETKLKVPDPVLRGSIVTTKVFDHPDRSTRGRTITHASLIHLKPTDGKLPNVKGSDDAAKARWFPLTAVIRPMMYEDHLDIIKNLTALI